MQLLDNCRRWIDAGLAFFYPEWCQVCDQGRATPAQGFICSDCRAKVKFITDPVCSRCGFPFPGAAITTEFECRNCLDLHLDFDWARSAVFARDPVLKAIHLYKYSRGLWCEPFLADLLTKAAAPSLSRGDWDMIVPVPLYPTKQREREFNQAERLARHLSRSTGIPLSSNVLKRIVPTPSQTTLDRKQRQDNMRHAFALAPKSRIAGQRVIILDDVFTTGATTSACSKVLRRAGASRVCVWTVARGS